MVQGWSSLANKFAIACIWKTMVKANILLIDDDENLRRVTKYNLEKRGYSVIDRPDGESGLEAFVSEPFDVVICDISMPGMNGIEVLGRVRELKPETEVVLITAYATVESAVDAMKKGAFDYVTKPFDREELAMVVERALKIRDLERENIALKANLKDKYRFDNIVGTSAAMQQVLRTAGKVAPSDASVLILGQSGTGKELMARGIHFNSERRRGPLVVVNCAAIPDTLIESELFGHKKGAFTGAVSDKTGKFEAASGGTIFLDEIGELKPDLQAKLLRVIQEREVERLGGSGPRSVDLRVIAATNVDIDTAVKDGRFRQDLYFRLGVIILRMPTLTERRGDIPLLVSHFLDKYGRGEDIRLEKEAMDLLIGYSWPGNVRELENVIERAVVLRDGPLISVAELPDMLKMSGEAFGGLRISMPPDGVDIDALEKDLLVHALRIHKGNQTKAAAFLHMTRPTLIYRMEKYGLKGGGGGE